MSDPSAAGPVPPALAPPSQPASLTLTAAATMSAATLAPAVAWLLNGCPRPIPDGVALTIAAVAIIAVHAAQKLFCGQRAIPTPTQGT